MYYYYNNKKFKLKRNNNDNKVSINPKWKALKNGFLNTWSRKPPVAHGMLKEYK